MAEVSVETFFANFKMPFLEFFEVRNDVNTRGTSLQSALSVSGLMHGCLAVSHGMDFTSESRYWTSHNVDVCLV